MMWAVNLKWLLYLELQTKVQASAVVLEGLFQQTQVEAVRPVELE